MSSTPRFLNGFGLLQVQEKITATSLTHFVKFIDFPVQEFLAAYYVANYSQLQGLSILSDYFWNKYYCFKHYIALTKGQQPALKHFYLTNGLFLKDFSITLH